MVGNLRNTGGVEESYSYSTCRKRKFKHWVSAGLSPMPAHKDNPLRIGSLHSYCIIRLQYGCDKKELAIFEKTNLT